MSGIAAKTTEWPCVSFLDVCDIQGGTQPPKDQWVAEPREGYVRMLQIRDFTQPGRSKVEYVKDNRKLKKCRSQDILIGRYGASVGKILHGLEGAYNVAIAKCILDRKRIERGYFLHWLQSRHFQHAVQNFGGRAAQAGFNKTDLRELQIPLPPLSEQKRIAGILDAADALRAKRRESLAQLDTLLQSTFLDMFGDPVTNPMGWEEAELRELGQISTGKTPPTKNEGMFGGDIPFATPGDLDNGLQSTVRTVTKKGAGFTKMVRAGSALVGCIGNIGKMAKSPKPTTFNQQINAVEWSERVDDSFGINALHHCIPQMHAKASSTTVPILNKSGFSSVQMIYPPIELQRRFASIVESVECQKERMREHLTELDTLFASLQSRAFNGEL